MKRSPRATWPDHIDTLTGIISTVTHPAGSQAAAGLVRLARSRAGLTQRQLAERAGVPQSVIARIESGARQPTIPTLERVLAGAGVEIRYRLEPVDDHDRVLSAGHARRSQADRESTEKSHAEFLAKVREGGHRARRTPSK
jgi:transcriptional regulator with XRE-family HTH domain